MSSDNRKIQRINSDILRILSVAIQQKMYDENFDGISILRVETTADLSEAKVYVAIKGDKNEIMGALERANGFLRNEVAQVVNMKQTPRLRFIADKGVENAARVEELLQKINAEGKK